MTRITQSSGLGIRLGLRAASGLILLVVLLVAVRHGLSDTAVLLVNTAAIYAVAALGLNIIFGQSDMLSVAQAAMMCLGGYAAAILAADRDSIVSLLAAAAAAGVVGGLILAVVSLRLRSHYFILVSVVLAEGVTVLAVNLSDLTGGSNGLPVGGFDAGDRLASLTIPATASLLVLPLLVVGWYVAECLSLSRFGLALRAIRADEYLAMASGISVRRTRTAALMACGALGGLGGGMLALTNGYIGPSDFSLDVSMLLLFIVLVAGGGSNSGVLAAAVILTYLTRGLLNLTTIGVLIYGLGITAVILFAPRGLSGLVETSGWSRLRAVVKAAGAQRKVSVDA